MRMVVTRQVLPWPWTVDLICYEAARTAAGLGIGSSFSGSKNYLSRLDVHPYFDDFAGSGGHELPHLRRPEIHHLRD